MIRRTIATKLRKVAGHYPVVLVTGPRQSGKTTLCRATFPDKAYVSLEAPDIRAFAASDPRGFLKEYSDGAVIDEIQRVPDLTSYMQTEVDERPEPGRFVLTGSQHFGLTESVSQSLAGRSGILTLLPPDLEELRSFPGAPTDLYSLLWQGAYPAIYDRGVPAHEWLADYAETYLQRDVRQIVNVGDLESFEMFTRLCAGRTAQVVNLSAVGADAGVVHNTARSWLSIMETSYLIHRLPAFHANVRKQIVKAPKLHFFDSGLACYLLGIREPAQLRLHPLRGAIFESWVVSEVYKSLANRGFRPRLFHYRESRGPEVDLVIQNGTEVLAVEAKSGETAAGDFFSALRQFADRMATVTEVANVEKFVVFGGDTTQSRVHGRLISWSDVNHVTRDIL